MCGVKIMGGRGTATDRGSSKFGGTATATARVGGGGATVEGYGKDEQALARRLFGKNVSGAELVTLAGGAPFKGAVVEVGIRNGRLQVDISHKFISKADGMTRTFFKDKNGKLAIENEAFFLTKSAQGKGIGRESFKAQVQAAKDKGAKYITTFALRNDARKDAAIGHKVWADFGYDAKLSPAIVRAWEGRNPLARFDGKTPRTIRELYNTRGGRELWHSKGEGGRMVFGLTRGSTSLKAFNKYLKGKGSNPIK